MSITWSCIEKSLRKCLYLLKILTNSSSSMTRFLRKISSPWLSPSAKSLKSPSKTSSIATRDSTITSTKESTTKCKSPLYLTSSKTKTKPANYWLKMFSGRMIRELKSDSFTSSKKSPNKPKNNTKWAWNKTRAFLAVTKTVTAVTR